MKIYLAILVIEVLLGVMLNYNISADVAPTAPVTAQELKDFRRTT